MKNFIKKIFKTLFPKCALSYEIHKILISDKNSYLYTTGWMNVFQTGKPVNQAGEGIPWIIYQAVNFLSHKLKPDFELFEFGSGYSTPFYAKLVRHVTSVEYDAAWYQEVKKMVPENVTLIFKEKDTDGEYCRVIGTTQKKYDVVVIDGRDRVNCIKQSIASLNPKGVIVLDNSQREAYKEGLAYARDKGFKILNLEGLKPGKGGLGQTSLLYRVDNCFDI